jgi:hypothetical protein
MKPNLHSLLTFAAAVGLLMMAGCATSNSMQTISLLAQAGFKSLPAATPEQQKELQRLPADQVSPVKRKGQLYYVYPDHAQKLLYVGKSAQFQAYQKLLLDRQQASQAQRLATEKANQPQATAEQRDLQERWDNPIWEQL